MPPLSILNPPMRRATLLLAAAFFWGAGLRNSFAAMPDEPSPDSVGVIDGDAITVTGPMSVEVVHGQARTMLRSGSDVRVKSGTARIDLVEGGQISVCGPAHFSVLKSGGSLTVALDTGTIHAHLAAQAGIERELGLTIYTAQIQAHAIAIGDGPQDLLVGIESPGAMCLRASRGAIRIEHQLSGQTVIIPQGGEVQLLDGQIESLRSDPGHCACELQTVKAPEPQPEVRQTATAEETRTSVLAARRNAVLYAAETAPSEEEPIYQVLMPPLVYDAKAKVQPVVDQKMIILVRGVRVRPSLIFQGRVEGEMVATAKPVPPAAPASAAPARAQPVATAGNDSFADRVRSFVRKLWSR